MRQIEMTKSISPIQRRWMGFVVAILLLGLLPAAPVAAQEPPPIYTFQECEQVESGGLRDELNQIAQTAFADGEDRLQIQQLVAEQWVLQQVDQVIDREIDGAVARVRQEEPYWDRVLSGWSTAKAEEFTTQVAAYAFGSEPFRAKLNGVALAVAEELGGEIEQLSARSASAALLCVQEFIGATYSATMMELFSAEMDQDLVGVDTAAIDVTVNPLLDSRQKSLAGIGVIIGSQIAKRLAKSLAQRIAGRVTGRLVGKAATTIIPLAGWIIGGGLLVWDLIEAGNGSLPQIQSALKAGDVKTGIQVELADSLQRELNAELPEVARTVSNDIYAQWVDFQRKYSRVLDLAAQDDRFRSVLDGAHVSDVYRLAEIVAILEQSEQPALLGETLAGGQLEQLLNLPAGATELLRSTASPAQVLAWADLAGGQLEQVVATGLYQMASPQDFADRAALEQILALEEHLAMDRAMLLTVAERNTLFRLPPDRVKALLQAYPPEDLRWLSAYIGDLELQAGNQLAARLLQEPALMPKLKVEKIRQAVVAGGDVEATLSFLSDPDTSASPIAQVTDVIQDTEKVITGQVAWALFLRKHATTRNGLVVGGLLGLLLLLWLLLRRRGNGVHVTVNVPPHRE